MRLPYVLLVSMLLMLGSIRAQAQLEVDLTANPISGAPGATVTFQATQVDLGSDPLFLNGVDLSGVPVGLNVDPSPLFASFPAPLNPGDSYSGDLFDVMIDPGLPPGSYTGVFTILGGLDPMTLNDLADVSFQVDVTPQSVVPEPGGPAWLAGLCAAGLGCAVRRTRLQRR